MTDVIEEAFRDRETCFREIAAARESWGTGLDADQWDQLEKTLGLMYLYCPDNVRPIVEATLFEAGQRRALLGI